MRLPTQAPNVNRANRYGDAKAKGVQPAFLGLAASLAPTLIKGIGSLLG